MTRHCQSHCRNCNLCFSSDTAFDLHLTHEGDQVFHDDPETAVHTSAKRLGQMKFESVAGLCSHQIGCWSDGKLVHEVPVTIHTLPMTAADRERLAALRQ